MPEHDREGCLTVEAGGEDLTLQLDRLERLMEEHRKEWQALVERLNPLLTMAETMTRWRSPLRRS